MEREDIIDLGIATVETKGPLEPIGDDVGGNNPLGLTDA
ncbi:MAG TPA: benenodin family lasso peptide [Sphingomonas sp.]